MPGLRVSPLLYMHV